MFLTHQTAEGDRWDWLAWRYYRDCAQMARLIEANPEAPATPTLPAGLCLVIPIIEPDAMDTAARDLPPWKQ